MNLVKTTFLLVLLTVVLVLVGGALGGTTGALIALVFSVIMNMGTYWFSDRVALAAARARPVSDDEMPQLHRIVSEVAQMSGVPTPKVYIIPTDAPNAFATGRNPNHSAVAVTSGIMRILDERELKGVLAHELGHVRNRDILIGSIAATIAGAITFMASMAQWALIFGGFGGRNREGSGNLLVALALIILAPIAAAVIQLAVSRQREYAADYTGAKVTGDPLALASALQKLERGVQLSPQTVGNLQTAHLYIVNPLRRQTFAGLFSTHPPIHDRVERLRRMAYGPNYQGE